MLGSAFITTVTLVAVQLPLASPQQAALDSLIAERRQEGYGPGQIVSDGAADLTGDGHPDIAAVYTYQIGPARDRSGVQFLVVLVGQGSGFRALGPWVIGSKGHRLVEALEIDNGVIRLRGRKYLVGDPQCCPAGTFEMELAVVDGTLREVRGAWVRPAIRLGLTRWDLTAPEIDVVGMMQTVAKHSAGEAELAEWIRSHLIQDPQ